MSAPPLDDIGTNLDHGSAYVFVRWGTHWSIQQKLIANDGAAGDQFGSSVAISGETVIAGAPLDNTATNSDQGAAYVFTRSGAVWAQRTKLTANDGAPDDQFGGAVAINDNTIVVGAYLDDNTTTTTGQEAAYVFVRFGSDWPFQQKLTANDGAEGDHFGNAVAISGDTAIAGAPQVKVGANASQGALYLFGCGYAEEKTLTGGVTGDYFGIASAIDGDTAVVGAPAYYAGTGSYKGSAYVYTRNGTAWTLSAQLLPTDVLADDYFGGSVAINRDTIVIGAPTKNINGVIDQGAVYVFVRTGGTWIQQARLVAGDGATEDYFGGSVSISGNLLAVGAPNRDVGGKREQGMVYLFTRSGTTWTPGVKLTADDGGERYFFGNSVSLSDFMFIAGAPGATVGASKQGAAYVFESSVTPWKQRAKLIDSEGKAGDAFGRSVALFGNTALIGSPRKDINGIVDQGAAFVFVSSRIGIWSQQDRLIQSDGALGDQLGLSVAVSGNTAVVGKEGLANPSGYRQGTANGPVSVMVTGLAGPTASGEIQITGVAPGLFAANSSGQGIAAALALRVKADGSQSFEPVAQFEWAQERFVHVPIDLGPATDQVFLVLYGTGLRFRSSLAAVNCAIGGASSDALFAGAVPGFAGLDQVNVRLPRSLAGRCEVEVALFVDSKAANTVRVSIR